MKVLLKGAKILASIQVPHSCLNIQCISVGPASMASTTQRLALWKGGGARQIAMTKSILVLALTVQYMEGKRSPSFPDSYHAVCERLPNDKRRIKVS